MGQGERGLGSGASLFGGFIIGFRAQPGEDKGTRQSSSMVSPLNKTIQEPFKAGKVPG